MKAGTASASFVSSVTMPGTEYIVNKDLMRERRRTQSEIQQIALGCQGTRRSKNHIGKWHIKGEKEKKVIVKEARKVQFSSYS